MTDAENLALLAKAHRASQIKNLIRKFESDPRMVLGKFDGQITEMRMAMLVIESTFETADTLLGVPKAVEAFARKHHADDELTADLVKVAQEQKNLGFPVLYGQFAILGWSALETFLRTTCRCWLSGPSSVWMHLSGLPKTVDLAEYERQRAAGTVGAYLFEMLEHRTRADSGGRLGVDRWRKVLKELDLKPGALSDESNDMVRELACVRNLLAHAPSGKADEDFLESWPTRWQTRWPGIKLGDVLPINNEDVWQYLTAAAEYAAGVDRTLRDRVDRLAENEEVPLVGDTGLVGLLANKP